LEAADEVVSGVSGAIANGQMTGDLAIAMGHRYAEL
jgi:isocitrate dehydrogenase